MNHSIKQLLNIQDPHIICTEVREERLKGLKVKLILGRLSYSPPDCSHCQTGMVKNGFTSSDILLLKTAGHKTILRLKKQRFLCPQCRSSRLAQTALVKPHHFISKAVYLEIHQLLMRRRSMTEIAFDLGISIPTVLRRLKGISFQRKRELPEVLLFDEFKFLKSQIAFNMVDGLSHQIIDVVPSRRLNALRDYFYDYPRALRKKVRLIVIDMYSPYLSLIKELFPNAQVSIDRFHIYQHLGRAFNNTRIRIMKQFGTKSKEYRHIKRFWKLLQKEEASLDYHYQYNASFRYVTSERDMIHKILNYDPTLKFYYDLYQETLDALKRKRADHLFHLIDRELTFTSPLNDFFKKTFRTFKRFKKEIQHALTYHSSNGPMEGMNNQIKVLKRIAFGYRNFENFRTRIFLVLGNKNTIKQNQEVIKHFQTLA